MNEKSGGVRDRVLNILRNNPEGLTIVDIAREIGMTRNAVTKYIYQLLGEKSIRMRDVGTAKLCYLCDNHG